MVGLPWLNALQLAAPLESCTKIKHYLGGAWSMHLPFAWDLVREFRPRTFVELGVCRGQSYFTFANRWMRTVCPPFAMVLIPGAETFTWARTDPKLANRPKLTTQSTRDFLNCLRW